MSETGQQAALSDAAKYSGRSPGAHFTADYCAFFRGVFPDDPGRCSVAFLVRICGECVGTLVFSLFLFISKVFNQPYSQMGKLMMRYSICIHSGCVKYSLIFITSLDIEYIFTILHYHKTLDVKYVY